MIERKKTPKVTEQIKDPLVGIEFDEALARLMQTDPKEMADVFEQNRDRAEQIRRNVAERRASIRSGPFTKRTKSP